MNIQEAINVISALDVKSEYEAIAKEMVLSEIDQLTNNWNELEGYFEEQRKTARENMQIIGEEGKRLATRFVVYNECLDKMKEIKDGN